MREGVVKQLMPLVSGIASDNWDVYLLDIFYFHRSIDYGLCTPTGGDDQRRNIVVMSGMLQTMEGML